jgi:hypothetical protein
MGHNMTNEWITVANAASILGVSKQAVRQRIYRDTIPHRKAADGTVYVRITQHNLEDNGDSHAENPGVTEPNIGLELVDELRDRIGFLERQLENEQRAHAELRRLFAGALERIPAIEAPLEVRESDLTATDRDESSAMPQNQEEAKSDPERRSWWRRLFDLPT